MWLDYWHLRYFYEDSYMRICYFVIIRWMYNIRRCFYLKRKIFLIMYYAHCQRYLRLLNSIYHCKRIKQIYFHFSHAKQTYRRGMQIKMSSLKQFPVVVILSVKITWLKLLDWAVQNRKFNMCNTSSSRDILLNDISTGKLDWI